MTDPTERKIASVLGQLMAAQAAINAILKTMPPTQREAFAIALDAHGEAARVHLMSSPVPEGLLDAFELSLKSTKRLCERL